MQDLSYQTGDPVFEWNGLRLSVQIYTFENVYGMVPGACSVRTADDRFMLRCTQLSWAGGQETAPGTVELCAEASPSHTTIEIQASAAHTIRCVKLIVHGIPNGRLLTLRETPALSVPDDGLLLRYPDGWRGLATPLIALERPGRGVTYARSLDTRVREKRFVLLPHGERMDLELIFEQAATEMSTSISVPAWEVGLTAALDTLMHTHTAHIERAYGLEPWETRADVPGWARRISLVAAIHCQHWSGYIFNDYDRVVRTIEWLTARIKPERLLVYLPGWEGRYYWQYGDYRPDPRMGGAQGFAALNAYAQRVGVKVMPMFGINVVNRGQPNFEQWGAPAETSHAGGVGGGATVDWDGSRHFDHVWGALLNPGAPTWQNRLVGQIAALVDAYGFDAVFLDISAVWLNDPRYDTAEGVVQLVERLRERHPRRLVAGEGWYDGVSRATPLMQAGHTDGRPHYHDVPYAPLFDTYARAFGHLCLGDPGRGSTGVHELGVNSATRVPLRRGIIPTVTIVDDTLERGTEQLERIIDDARSYAARYIDT